MTEKSKSATTSVSQAFDDLMAGPILRLVPGEARRVRKPDGALLAAEGENVDCSPDRTYWLRRLSDGDIEAGPPIDDETDSLGDPA